MNYINIWMHACATLVTLVTVWKIFSSLGWQKGILFNLVRGLSEGKGVVQGVLMIPALVLDTVLSPVYFLFALSKGTIDKQLANADYKKWSDKALLWNRQDLNELKKDFRDLLELWVTDDSVLVLEEKMEELIGKPKKGPGLVLDSEIEQMMEDSNNAIAEAVQHVQRVVGGSGGRLINNPKMGRGGSAFFPHLAAGRMVSNANPVDGMFFILSK